MRTRTIVIIALLGLLLVLLLKKRAPAAAAQPQPVQPQTPLDALTAAAGAAGLDFGSAAGDVMHPAVSTFLSTNGPGLVAMATAPIPGVSTLPNSPYSPPMAAASPPVASSPANVFGAMPGTDLGAGLLRGWGRLYGGGGWFTTHAAAELAAKNTQNLTPNGSGGRWTYTGPTYSPQPDNAEWARFDAARGSLRAGR